MCFKSSLIYLKQESTTNFNCLAIAFWMPDRSVSVAHIGAWTECWEASRTGLGSGEAADGPRGPRLHLELKKDSQGKLISNSLVL